MPPSPASSSSLLQRYTSWVKQHPGLVQNLDWLLYIVQWNPGRLSSSEFTYEAYHAAVGLLSVWHAQILEEDVRRSTSSRGLDLIEQVRACMHAYRNTTYKPADLHGAHGKQKHMYTCGPAWRTVVHASDTLLRRIIQETRLQGNFLVCMASCMVALKHTCRLPACPPLRLRH